MKLQESHDRMLFFPQILEWLMDKPLDTPAAFREGISNPWLSRIDEKPKFSNFFVLFLKSRAPPVFLLQKHN